MTRVYLDVIYGADTASTVVAPPSEKAVKANPSQVITLPPDEHVGLPHHPSIALSGMTRLSWLTRSSASLQTHVLSPPKRFDVRSETFYLWCSSATSTMVPTRPTSARKIKMRCNWKFWIQTCALLGPCLKLFQQLILTTLPHCSCGCACANAFLSNWDNSTSNI